MATQQPPAGLPAYPLKAFFTSVGGRLFGHFGGGRRGVQPFSGHAQESMDVHRPCAGPARQFQSNHNNKNKLSPPAPALWAPPKVSSLFGGGPYIVCRLAIEISSSTLGPPTGSGQFGRPDDECVQLAWGHLGGPCRLPYLINHRDEKEFCAYRALEVCKRSISFVLLQGRQPGAWNNNTK